MCVTNKERFAALVQEWAKGKVIEFRSKDAMNSLFHDWRSLEDVYGDLRYEGHWEYRIKPEPKPDVVQYRCFAREGVSGATPIQTGMDNVKITFDGETGKLKSVEIIK